MSLNNIIITGASSGLGEALAHNLAQKGAHLTLTARRLDRLQHLRDALHEQYPHIEILVEAADVTNKIHMEQLIDKSAAHFGGIDGVIANAGLGMWTRFSDLDDPDSMHDIMQINYMGIVYALFYALPHLRRKHGSFVAISSIQGAIPVAYHTGYVASKFAVNGLMQSIRLEEPDVHFLLALPSWISGTELRSHALASDAAHAISVKKSHGKSATSAKDCAEQIIAAMMAEKTEIFIPKSYRMVPLLRDLFKETFDRVVLNKVNGQLE